MLPGSFSLRSRPVLGSGCWSDRVPALAAPDPVGEQARAQAAVMGVQGEKGVQGEDGLASLGDEKSTATLCMDEAATALLAGTCAGNGRAGEGGSGVLPG